MVVCLFSFREEWRRTEGQREITGDIPVLKCPSIVRFVNRFASDPKRAGQGRLVSYLPRLLVFTLMDRVPVLIVISVVNQLQSSKRVLTVTSSSSSQGPFYSDTGHLNKTCPGSTREDKPPLKVLFIGLLALTQFLHETRTILFGYRIISL